MNNREVEVKKVKQLLLDNKDKFSVTIGVDEDGSKRAFVYLDQEMLSEDEREVVAFGHYIHEEKSLKHSPLFNFLETYRVGNFIYEDGEVVAKDFSIIYKPNKLSWADQDVYGIERKMIGIIDEAVNLWEKVALSNIPEPEGVPNKPLRRRSS